MRLGSTGLIVDYIVSKLLDEYPEMDSGSFIGWTSTNTKYLKKYIDKYMPKVAGMMSVSSYNIDTNPLYVNPFANEGAAIENLNESVLMKKDYVSTIGVLVDTGKGSIYSSNDLKTISIPIDISKKYKLLINYDNSSSKLNYRDINNSRDLVTYSLITPLKGKRFENSFDVSRGLIKISDKISNEKKKSENFTYYKIEYTNKPHQLIDQSITVNTKDIVKIPANSKFTYRGTTYTTSTEVTVAYSNTTDTITLTPSVNGLSKIERGSEVTNINALTLTRSGVTYNLSNGNGTNFCQKLSNIRFGIYDTVANGVVVATQFLIKGDSYILPDDKDNYITCQEIIDGNGITIESTTTISSNGNYFIDGVEYLLYSGTKITRINDTREVVEPQQLQIDIDYSSLKDDESFKPAGGSDYNIIINDSDEDYNLILQLPSSAVGYSLIESSTYKINNKEYDLISYDEFINDSLLVTSSYLDSILIDRTITEYSRPDDVECLQRLCMSAGGYQPENLGFYDDKLKAYVAEAQSSSQTESNPKNQGLGRTTYVTGWCDPETEIFLEVVRNGYGK